MPEVNSRARYAFICYAREDAAQVDMLHRDLETAGIRVWRDTKELWPGDDWRERINEAIDRESFVFIACFSRQGLSRERSYQNRELLQAVEQLRERPQGDQWFIPVRLDDCEIPDYDLGGGRTLASLQPTDLFDERRDEQATRLVQTVLRNLKRQEGRGAWYPLGWLRSGKARAITAGIAAAVGASVVLPIVLSPASPASPASRLTAGTSFALSSPNSPNSLGSLAGSFSPGSTQPASTPPQTLSLSTFARHRMFPARGTVSIAPASALPAGVHDYSGGGYDFDSPEAIAADGTHVWVANSDGNSVTELKEDNGSLVQNLPAARYGFSYPSAIAVAGGHVWVVNRFAHTVTELNAADGSLVRTLDAASLDATYPFAIAADGAHVWVTNGGGGHGSVTELDAADGSLVRTLTSPAYGFDVPGAIAADSRHVWVANTGGGDSSVTELNAADGSPVQVLNSANDDFDIPEAITSDGTHVWVANYYNDSVTELSADTGSLVQVVSRGTYDFYGPDAIAADGTHVWVASDYGDSVTELNAANGSLVKIFYADTYGWANPQSIAADGTHVWVGSEQPATNSAGSASWVTAFPVSRPAAQ